MADADSVLAQIERDRAARSTRTGRGRRAGGGLSPHQAGARIPMRASFSPRISPSTSLPTTHSGGAAGLMSPRDAKKLRAIKTELKKQQQQIKTDRQALDVAKRALEQEKMKIRNQQDQMDNERTQWKDKLRKVTAEKTRLENQNSKLTEMCKKLNNEISQLVEENQDLEDQIETLEDEKMDAATGGTGNRLEIDTLNAQINELRQELNKAQTALKSAKVNTGIKFEKGRHILNLEKENAANKRVIASLKKQLSEIGTNDVNFLTSGGIKHARRSSVSQAQRILTENQLALQKKTRGLDLRETKLQEGEQALADKKKKMDMKMRLMSKEMLKIQEEAKANQRTKEKLERETLQLNKLKKERKAKATNDGNIKQLQAKLLAEQKNMARQKKQLSSEWKSFRDAKSRWTSEKKREMANITKTKRELDQRKRTSNLTVASGSAARRSRRGSLTGGSESLALKTLERNALKRKNELDRAKKAHEKTLAQFKQSQQRLKNAENALGREKKAFATEKKRLERERQKLKSEKDRLESEKKMFAKQQRISQTKGRRQSVSRNRRGSISDMHASSASNRKNSLLVEANSLEELRANIRKEQLEAMKAEFSEMKAKLEAAKVKFEESKQAFKQEQEDFEKEQTKMREAQIAKLASDRKKLEEESIALARHKSKAISSLSALDSERQQLQAERIKLDKDRQKHNLSVRQFQIEKDDNAFKTDKIDDLRFELKELQIKYTTTAADLAGSTSDIHRLQKEIEGYKQDISVLEDRIKKQQNDMITRDREHEEELLSLHKELDEKDLISLDKENREKELQQEIKELTNKLEDKHEVLMQTKQQVKQVKEGREKIKKQVKEFQHSVKERIKELRTDETNLITAVKTILSSLENTNPTVLQEKLQKRPSMSPLDKAKIRDQYNHKIGNVAKNIPALLKPSLTSSKRRGRKNIPVNPYFRDLFSSVLERLCLMQINAILQLTEDKGAGSKAVNKELEEENDRLSKKLSDKDSVIRRLKQQNRSLQEQQLDIRFVEAQEFT